MTRKIFVVKSLAENEAGRLIPDLVFFLKKKALYEVKLGGLQLHFNIFS